jgi:hypothetical protein
MVCEQMIQFMRGSVRDGGVISLDLVEEFDITTDQASARLAYLVTRGSAIRVGKQKINKYGNDFTIYILKSEEEEWSTSSQKEESITKVR